MCDNSCSLSLEITAIKIVLSQETAMIFTLYYSELVIPMLILKAEIKPVDKWRDLPFIQHTHLEIIVLTWQLTSRMVIIKYNSLRKQMYIHTKGINQYRASKQDLRGFHMKTMWVQPRVASITSFIYYWCLITIMANHNADILIALS